MGDINFVVHVAGPLADDGQQCSQCGAELHPQDVGRWNEGFRVVEYQAEDPRERRRLQLLPDEPMPEGASTCGGRAE